MPAIWNGTQQFQNNVIRQVKEIGDLNIEKEVWKLSLSAKDVII